MQMRAPPVPPRPRRPPLSLVPQILTSLVERFGEALGRWDDAPAVLLPPLMDKFADNRIVIRQANLTAVRALIHTLSPRRALRPMLTYISNPNSHIREQAITVLAQTMQASPTQPLELHRAALGALSLALEDVKPRVARAALDAMPVLAEAAGAPVFEWLMRELSMPESSEARVWERLKHGAAPPIAEALVEFTSQSSLSLPAVSDAPVRQGSASRRMADAPPTDDFSDLMENTAGGRPIATCGRGRLPWTRGGARGLGGMGALSEGNDPDEPAAGGDSYGWEGGARTDSVLGRRASASEIGGGAPPRAFRGRSEMSIVLPGEAALAPGPKSAPPMGAPAAPAPVMSGTPRSPRLRSALSSGGPSDRVTPASDSPPSPRSPTDWTDGAVSSSLPSPPRAGGMPSGSESTSPMGGRDSPAASFASPLLASFASFSSPVFGGSPASFASAASLGASSPHRSRDKILMWLPEAGAAADDAEPLLAPTARRPADGDESAGAGAHADPLKLLKQRRATPSAEELARASTATGGLRASPQVRLPFEERQRSQSAPQKRTAVASDEKVDSVDDGLSGAVAGTPEGRRAGLHIEPPPSVRADRTGRPFGMRPWRSSRLAGGDGGGVMGGGIDDGRRGAMGSGISLDVVGRSASAGGTGGAHDEQADAKGARGRGGGGWGSAEKGGATGGITELRTEDLSSYPPPGATETTVARAMAALRGGDRDGDWAAQFEAINTLRRLFASQPVGAPDAAILAQLHALNLLLLQFSDSLRSALAKNASMAFREMFCSMGKHMEADLDLITPVLIKKCAESNGFIAEEANRALAAMAVSVSEGRAIGALAGCASHRNPQARAKAALHLSRALEGMGWSRVLGMRELDKVVQVFGALNSEGLSETRIATKHGLVCLIREARRQGGDAQDRLERLLARCLPEPDQRKLLDAASASLTGTFPAPLEDMPEVSGRGAKGSRGSRHGTPGAVRPPPPEPLAGGGAVDEQLGSILGSLSSSDWISRRDGATQLLALVRAQPQAVPRSARLLSVLDALAPQLSYANPKVNLAALAALEGVAPMLKDALAPVAPGLVQALASCLASSNTQVGGVGEVGWRRRARGRSGRWVMVRVYCPGEATLEGGNRNYRNSPSRETQHIPSPLPRGTSALDAPPSHPHTHAHGSTYPCSPLYPSCPTPRKPSGWYLTLPCTSRHVRPSPPPCNQPGAVGRPLLSRRRARCRRPLHLASPRRKLRSLLVPLQGAATVQSRRSLLTSLVSRPPWPCATAAGPASLATAGCFLLGVAAAHPQPPSPPVPPALFAAGARGDAGAAGCYFCHGLPHQARPGEQALSGRRLPPLG